MTRQAPPRVAVITQQDGAGARLEARLVAAGVRTWMAPVTAHEGVRDTRELDECLTILWRFDWLAMTSARAVEFVAQRPAWMEWVASGSRTPRVAAVGTQTAESLAAHGVREVLCPPRHGGAHLARAIIEAAGGSLLAQSVLWPRSSLARRDLASALAAAGATVIEPVAYRTVGRPLPDSHALIDAIRQGQVDAVTFLSPSSAEFLAAALGFESLSVLPGRTIVASIGPTTSKTLVRLGAPPVIESSSPSGDALAEALLAFWRQEHGVLS